MISTCQCQGAGTSSCSMLASIWMQSVNWIWLVVRRLFTAFKHRTFRKFVFINYRFLVSNICHHQNTFAKHFFFFSFLLCSVDILLSFIHYQLTLHLNYIMYFRIYMNRFLIKSRSQIQDRSLKIMSKCFHSHVLCVVIICLRVYVYLFTLNLCTVQWMDPFEFHLENCILNMWTRC